jgi:hypothetical protein
MGNLDPYDGQVTYRLLQSLAERSGECIHSYGMVRHVCCGSTCLLEWP